MVNSKSAFWQAFVFSIVLFILGIALGFFLENSRADQLQLNSIRSEINLLDEQIRNKMILESNVPCDIALNDTFAFADKIYGEASKLEQYDAVSKLTNSLQEIHKRYDLMRMILWDESIYLRKNCRSDFHTVVYFFDYNSEDSDIRAEQLTFSRMLIELKKNNPNHVLLIPIASNLQLESVDLAMKSNNITKAPAILVDEHSVVSKLITFDELEKVVLKGNKE